MKFTTLIITFLLAVNSFSQNDNFAPKLLSNECDETVDFQNFKNNRLISFAKNEYGYTADFIFVLNCCGEYEFIGHFSNDSLFLKAKQTNNISCDCNCYFKTTLQLPVFNPELVFWNSSEDIGIKQTEYIEYPVSFEIFEEDTINYVDKFKKRQGKFIYGEDKQNPRAILEIENDSIVSGWSINEYHNNRTAYILKAYNKHNIGDKAIYTYLDSNQQIIKSCYRYYPRALRYFEFCTDTSAELLNKLDSTKVKYVTFISDTLILTSGGVLNVNYTKELQKIEFSKKITHIVLLESLQYGKDFLSKLEAIKSEYIKVHRKELLQL
jgi:hypothetical protein